MNFKKNLILMLLILALPAFAEDVSTEKANHQEMIEKYELKIKALDADIAEQEQMKKDFVKKYYVGEKYSPKQKLEKMKKHYDKIIDNEKKMKVEYERMLTFHKLTIAELEKDK